jgi:pyruvate, water dikinase
MSGMNGYTSPAGGVALVEAPPSLTGAEPESLIVQLDHIGRADVAKAGGKGANLGEMLHAGLPVPGGFVITVQAFERFIQSNALDTFITATLASLDVNDSAALERTANVLRERVTSGVLPPDLREAIISAYALLTPEAPDGKAPDPFVAVRSSATAEDNVEFSFAGMFESFLDVRGPDELLDRVRACWASTFGARVLFYRIKRGLPAQMPVAVIVQRMIDSTKSGVMFSVDPATHDPSRVVIEAAWGLGEVVVGGQVVPDRYVLHKPSGAVLQAQIGAKDFLLTRDARSGRVKSVNLLADARRNARVLEDAELRTLVELANRLEEHYGSPQDIEFAIDQSGIYLTQTRPITTLGGQAAAPTPPTRPAPQQGPILRGLGASPGVGAGSVRVLASVLDAAELQPGEVLVTHMTSPDWVPLMRRASAIVTDAGGMTSHAAIVSRELGIPCVVGTHEGTHVLRTGTAVTVDGGAGTVSLGRAPSGAAASGAPAMNGPRETPLPVASPALVTATRVYVNLAEPERATEVARRDVDGVGLLRAEFMLLEALEHQHPRAFLAERTPDEFVKRMVEHLRTFADAFYPRPVVYRAMDFRSNEFRGLTGGNAHEPSEENPMIGYRGCFRYTREPDLFALELRAIAEVRRERDNVHLMIPFVRTGWELEACMRLVDASPLAGDRTLRRWIMAEVPSAIAWLPAYAKMGVTGVSIGSNDLTQLMLGVDRDSELLAPYYDERDPAVLDAIHQIITKCKELGLTCSICGQAPSVHPEYAEQLVRWGIDSISVNPDVLERTRRNVAIAEQRIILGAARQGSGER